MRNGAPVQHPPTCSAKVILVLGAKNSLRVRIVDDMSARLTVKFERRQLSREEYEYEIPYEEAIELLSHASSGVIEKTRYTLPHGRFVWEVDVFSGARAGLIIAEIELTREDDQLQTPRGSAGKSPVTSATPTDRWRHVNPSP
jgi:adenylate cyclase